MLNVVTREEAVRIILEKIPEAADVETVGLPDALDKVVAEDILSPEDLPAYARSTVDGFAVRASDTYGCSEALPAMVTYAGKVLMGEDEKRVLPKASCMAVPTGGQVPEGADAVVMVEHSEDLGDEFRYMLKPVAPGRTSTRRATTSPSAVSPSRRALCSNPVTRRSSRPWAFQN